MCSDTKARPSLTGCTAPQAKQRHSQLVRKGLESNLAWFHLIISFSLLPLFLPLSPWLARLFDSFYISAGTRDWDGGMVYLGIKKLESGGVRVESISAEVQPGSTADHLHRRPTWNSEPCAVVLSAAHQPVGPLLQTPVKAV